jgi:hypothetical protein
MMKNPLSILAALVVVAGIGSVTRASAADFDPATATYSFAGDTFTLANGEAKIMGHSGLADAPDTMIPVGYNLAKSASGDIAGDGRSGEAVVLYRGFGANLQWITLFGYEPQGSGFTQVAASAVYQEAAAVQSVSVDSGVVTVDLLVVSEADKKLAHYEQKPTEPLTLKFKVDGDTFVAAP